MSEGYTPIVFEHFNNPRNVGRLDPADGVGQAENPISGASLVLYLGLSQDRITQAMFEAEGCAATIAAGSMLTGLLVGLTPEEALALSRDAVEEALGGLPPTRRHAAALAIDATRAAVRDYRSGVLC